MTAFQGKGKQSPAHSQQCGSVARVSPGRQGTAEAEAEAKAKLGYKLGYIRGTSAKAKLGVLWILDIWGTAEALEFVGTRYYCGK